MEPRSSPEFIITSSLYREACAFNPRLNKMMCLGCAVNGFQAVLPASTTSFRKFEDDGVEHVAAHTDPETLDAVSSEQ